MSHALSQQSRRSKSEDLREMRARRLAEINERLAELNLQQFQGLGNYKRGQTELKHIISEHRYPHDWEEPKYWVITYACIWPDGTHGEWAMIFNGVPKDCAVGGMPIVISGSHCVVTLNRERYVFTQQHRQTLDGWNPRPIETVRGFNSSNVVGLGLILTRRAKMPLSIDLKDPITALPLQVVSRKLAPLMTSGLVEVQEMNLLGVSWENSGTTRVFVVKSHLDLIAHDLEAVLKIKGPPAMRIHYPTFEEVDDGFYEMGLAGEQCTSDLWYFDRLVRRHW